MYYISQVPKNNDSMCIKFHETNFVSTSIVQDSTRIKISTFTFFMENLGWTSVGNILFLN